MWYLLACQIACQNSALQLQIKDATLSVEIADEVEERSLGLMYRDTLAPDAGMLFVYPDSAPRSFWMKNTRIPLSIAFVDDSGKIVHLADMKPMDTHTTDSKLPARFALEVNQGWFAQHHVVVGDSIAGLPLPPRSP
jgi:uncharacterized membrane protein (UPF0127 family)